MSEEKTLTVKSLTFESNKTLEVYPWDFGLLPEEYTIGTAYFSVELTRCPAEPEVGYMFEYNEGSAELLGIAFERDTPEAGSLILSREKAVEFSVRMDDGQSFIAYLEDAVFEEAAAL
jgi:hypothetical protein